jgi:lysozyme
LAVLSVTSVCHAQILQTEAGYVSQSQIEDLGQPLGAAQQAAARPLSKVALEMIKDFEGWVPSAYNDPSGYCTIGYGHLIALKRCEEIDLGDFKRALTPSEGEALLQRDTASARLAVQRETKVDLNDDQFGSLAAFVFNIGKANFQNSTLVRILNAGNYSQTPSEMKRWVSSKGILSRSDTLRSPAS